MPKKRHSSKRASKLHRSDIDCCDASSSSSSGSSSSETSSNSDSSSSNDTDSSRRSSSTSSSDSRSSNSSTSTAARRAGRKQRRRVKIKAKDKTSNRRHGKAVKGLLAEKELHRQTKREEEELVYLNLKEARRLTSELIDIAEEWSRTHLPLLLSALDLRKPVSLSQFPMPAVPSSGSLQPFQFAEDTEELHRKVRKKVRHMLRALDLQEAAPTGPQMTTGHQPSGFGLFSERDSGKTYVKKPNRVASLYGLYMSILKEALPEKTPQIVPDEPCSTSAGEQRKIENGTGQDSRSRVVLDFEIKQSGDRNIKQAVKPRNNNDTTSVTGTVPDSGGGLLSDKRPGGGEESSVKGPTLPSAADLKELRKLQDEYSEDSAECEEGEEEEEEDDETMKLVKEKRRARREEQRERRRGPMPKVPEPGKAEQKSHLPSVASRSTREAGKREREDWMVTVPDSLAKAFSDNPEEGESEGGRRSKRGRGKEEERGLSCSTLCYALCWIMVVFVGRSRGG
eukprot:GHVQ01031574.1.p1 GENE.GHVQ01031574.1~~GHVQ01031574.1.p1  ORF type:complete len:510 (-),score=103.49 GHVQ01031574.1:938-2467(-)